MTAPVDLLVLGGGAAGLTAARTAAGLGATVTLVDRAQPGGDCLWTGCVPSKALLAAARSAHARRDGRLPGIDPDDAPVRFDAVRAHVHAAIAAIAPHDAPDALAADGVTVLRGAARFTGPDRAEVHDDDTGTDTEVVFRRAVIATGAAPAAPPVAGLAAALDAGLAVTSDTVWDLTDLPTRLVVLGAGAVGCELSQAFARLGAEVDLVESAPGILPSGEPDAAAVLAARLASEGVTVRPGTTAGRVDADGGTLTVTLDDGTRLPADRVLVATGRRPDTAALDPAAAGVVVGDGGEVVVDDRLRTANPRVFAAGDVTGGALTHVAGVQGSTAATNALLAPVRGAGAADPVRVTFTDPEVAQVGPLLADAGPRARVRRLDHTRLDRAIAEGETDGFTRVVLDRRGRVLAATVVGPRAGEAITGLAALVARRAPLRELAAVTHPYPGWNDAAWRLAVAELTDRLRRPLPARLGRLVLALHRRRDRRG